jgi:Domain of unknown function (DUF222)/HNH endonuclease
MDEIRSASGVAGLLAAVRGLRPAGDEVEAIERIRLFEQLKSAVAAAQAEQTAAFDTAQRTAAAVAGVPAKDHGRGVAAQVGLARRISPWQASRYVGWCAILTRELPCTFAQLQAGQVSEWRAMIVARETIWLSRTDRAVVDAELAPQLPGLGDRRLEAAVRKAAYRLDPRGFLERSRAAEKDRRVTLRPAPDTMTRLTALLPVAQGVAAYAALCTAADTTVAVGDERGRGQIMADTLVQRLTGQTTANAVPVEIELVMTDRTLLDPDSTEPATIPGYGPVPAALARELALGAGPNADADAETDSAPRWLRRLFRHPHTGELAAMETRRRLFTTNQARFIRLREDGICRTPWCDAPIRHTDHIRPHEQGGRTAVDNGQGLCEACNHTRQAPGWHGTVHGTTITLTTPTGHHYRSRPPDPPRSPPDNGSPVERELARRLVTA